MNTYTTVCVTVTDEQLDAFEEELEHLESEKKIVKWEEWGCE